MEVMQVVIGVERKVLALVALLHPLLGEQSRLLLGVATVHHSWLVFLPVVCQNFERRAAEWTPRRRLMQQSTQYLQVLWPRRNC